MAWEVVEDSEPLTVGRRGPDEAADEFDSTGVCLRIGICMRWCYRRMRRLAVVSCAERNSDHNVCWIAEPPSRSLFFQLFLYGLNMSSQCCVIRGTGYYVAPWQFICFHKACLRPVEIGGGFAELIRLTPDENMCARNRINNDSPPLQGQKMYLQQNMVRRLCWAVG